LLHSLVEGGLAPCVALEESAQCRHQLGIRLTSD
jgi:hypothetical protein